MSKAVPVIGLVVDFGTSVLSRETVQSSAIKSIVHLGVDMLVEVGVTALAISGGWAIAAGVGASILINSGVDYLYDKYVRDYVDNMQVASNQ